jgi:hypothetical protein
MRRRPCSTACLSALDRNLGKPLVYRLNAQLTYRPLFNFFNFARARVPLNPDQTIVEGGGSRNTGRCM